MIERRREPRPANAVVFERIGTYKSNLNRMKELLDEISTDIEVGKVDMLTLRTSVDEMAAAVYRRMDHRADIITALQQEWKRIDNEKHQT